MMARGVFCLALFGLVASASCASLGRPALKLPFEKRCLYAPIFVDRTEGQIAPVLYEALNQRLYRRAPKFFSFEYADDCAVIDGTVLTMTERSEGNSTEIAVEVSALALDKMGHRADLGVLSQTIRFRDDAKERERAMAQLCFTLADDLLDALATQ